MLGLKKNLNLLVDFDPLWESAFVTERGRIAEAPDGVAKGIEHHGSTAVPGMKLAMVGLPNDRAVSDSVD